MALLVQVRSERTNTAFGGAVELRGDVVGDRRRVATALTLMVEQVEAGGLDDLLTVEGADADAVAVAQEHAQDVVTPVQWPSGLAVGRIVHYRSRTGRYTLPAIVLCTGRSIDPEGVDRGDIPALTSDFHVHLLVGTPGAQESYVEHDVPMFVGEAGLPVTSRPSPGPGELEPLPRTWYWPSRDA